MTMDDLIQGIRTDLKLSPSTTKSDTADKFKAKNSRSNCRMLRSLTVTK